MDNLSLIIEDGYNTSYITTLFMALFYKSNSCSDILNADPVKNEMIYLQELIKDKFIDPINNNRSIFSSTINEIRNYINICYPTNNLTELRDIKEFFNFFLKNTINFEVKIDKILKNEPDKIINISYQMIDLEVNKDLNDAFEEWIKINITNHATYKLAEIPIIIPFFIKKEDIDICFRTKFYHLRDNYQDCLYWGIQSIICQNEKGYYTIICSQDREWFLFSDKNIPSIQRININDYENTIKKDCLIIIFQSL